MYNIFMMQLQEKLEIMEAENREARLESKGRAMLRIEMQRKSAAETATVCHDDSAPPMRAQTIDELHCLQKKKSAPNTPRTARTLGQGQGTTFAIISEEDLQK
ncbi:hypothetical protein CMV_010534 [Castanea mollissima]|uniref:Uncharacterized protein n=1 Tax=Castanea mollissima TaxID=60419 RepID=A0A8J4W0N8_9ROSI|nr:hypothetical protein CMV_010534 [Castanea mollissima]